MPSNANQNGIDAKKPAKLKNGFIAFVVWRLC